MGSEPFDVMEPGGIWHAPDGRDITFNSPPQNSSYDAYTKVSLRALAVGMGVSAHSLTGDLSDLNFSSGRLGWQDDQRQINNWQWQMFVPQFCGGVAGWLLRVLDQVGQDTAGVTVDWTPPRREMINPPEDVKANRDAIRSGQKSWSQVVRESGDDPDQVAGEIATDNARFDRLKLILDCDPRKVTSVGMPTEPMTTTAGVKAWLEQTYPDNPGNAAAARQIAAVARHAAAVAQLERSRPGDPDNASAANELAAMMAVMAGEDIDG